MSEVEHAPVDRHAGQLAGTETKAGSLRWSLGLLATSLAFAIVQLDVTILNVALDEIAGTASGGVAELQWVVNGYTLAFAGLLLTGGALGDRFGPRRVYIAGLAVFTAASLACGLASSGGGLIAGRVLQGIGAALLLPCSLALVVHMHARPDERAKAVGLWGAAGGVAMALGPAIGGLLIDLAGWRSIFLVNLPLGVLAICITWRSVPEVPAQASRSVDLVGQSLAIVVLVSLMTAIIEGARLGGTHPVVLASLFMCALAGSSFAIFESRMPDPMLPLGIFKSPTFSAASAVGVVLSFGFYGMIFLYSLYFQRRLGLAPLTAGLAFAPMTGVMALGNMAAGYASAWWGPRIPIVAGLLCCACGYGAQAILLDASTGYAEIWWSLLLVGPGAALAITAMTNMALAAAASQRTGIASGILNALRQTAGAVGVAILGSLGVGGTSLAGIRDAAALVAGLHVAAALGCIAPTARDRWRSWHGR